MAAAAVLPVSAGISDDAAMAPYVYPESSHPGRAELSRTVVRQKAHCEV